ncbi:hypothetical protein ENSA5_57460 [Enhygromyxa salina]|uniref:Uncharacterized protein n=1 Tax=Enhygromyxa salina TaxID=215803 RepID=A0A2S9XEE3_9BACT|nr:hypothetical protein ENSA5_57460 [Enhygromyxa salina]
MQQRTVDEDLDRADRLLDARGLHARAHLHVDEQVLEHGVAVTQARVRGQDTVDQRVALLLADRVTQGRRDLGPPGFVVLGPRCGLDRCRLGHRGCRGGPVQQRVDVDAEPRAGLGDHPQAHERGLVGEVCELEAEGRRDRRQAVDLPAALLGEGRDALGEGACGCDLGVGEVVGTKLRTQAEREPQAVPDLEARARIFRSQRERVEIKPGSVAAVPGDLVRVHPVALTEQRGLGQAHPARELVGAELSLVGGEAHEQVADPSRTAWTREQREREGLDEQGRDLKATRAGVDDERPAALEADDLPQQPRPPRGDVLDVDRAVDVDEHILGERRVEVGPEVVVDVRVLDRLVLAAAPDDLERDADLGLGQELGEVDRQRVAVGVRERRALLDDRGEPPPERGQLAGGSLVVEGRLAAVPQQPVELGDRQATVADAVDELHELQRRRGAREGVSSGEALVDAREDRQLVDAQPQPPGKNDTAKQRGEVGEGEFTVGQLLVAGQRDQLGLVDPQRSEHDRPLLGRDRRSLPLDHAPGGRVELVERGHADLLELLGQEASTIERARTVVVVARVDHAGPERRQLVPREPEPLVDPHDVGELAQRDRVERACARVDDQDVEHARRDPAATLQPSQAMQAVERVCLQECDRRVFERAGLAPLQLDLPARVDVVAG